jgi:hypothetical protein
MIVRVGVGRVRLPKSTRPRSCTGQKPGQVNATDRALVSPTRSATSYKIAIAQFVHNDRVIDALVTQAFRALDASPGARAYYDQLKPGAPTTTPFTIVGCLSSCWDVSQVVGCGGVGATRCAVTSSGIATTWARAAARVAPAGASHAGSHPTAAGLRSIRGLFSLRSDVFAAWREFRVRTQNPSADAFQGFEERGAINRRAGLTRLGTGERPRPAEAGTLTVAPVRSG